MARNRREYLRQKQLDSDLINHRITPERYAKELVLGGARDRPQLNIAPLLQLAMVGAQQLPILH